MGLVTLSNRPPDHRLTFLIPTHNRPHFLRRLFEFYSQFPPDANFVVVDSSSSELAAKNRDVIANAQRMLSVTYQHLDFDFVTKCARVMKTISSPFLVCCADDDVVFPQAVDRAVEFLTKHPDYAVATGADVLMNVSKPGNPCHVGSGYSIVDDNVLRRCRHMADCWFTTFYGVYRTETLRHHFQIAAENLDSQWSYFFPEMLLSQLCVIRGKVHVSPQLFALREAHQSNAGRTHRPLDAAIAESQFQSFRLAITTELQAQGIAARIANMFVERWYGHLRFHAVRDLSWLRRSELRFQRFVQRTKRQVLNLIRTDGVITKRPLADEIVVGQQAEWSEATRLMSTFPNGLECHADAARNAA